MPELTNINQLIASLASSAELLANEMRNRTAGGQYPSGLSSSITVGQVNTSGEDKLTCRISVNHPAGAAYEWGSGLHSTKGPAETYQIRPKRASALAIPFERWPDFQFPVVSGKKMMGSSEGKFFLRYVDHPGVEARPYVEPSIQAKRKEIAKMLGRGFVASITRKEKEIVEIRVDI